MSQHPSDASSHPASSHPGTRIAIGSDHRGADAADDLAEALRSAGHDVSLIGAADGPCDYPEPAYQVATAVASGDVQMGILLCGSGIGMSIAANKIKGIRAAVVHDELTSQLSRQHNNANVLCLSADLLGQKLVEQIAKVFLKTDFEGGRHARRVRKIAAIEDGIDPATVEDEA